MRRLAISTSILAVLALPAAADASIRFIIKGAGFGHGIGMSQYGAYGFALHGWDYRQILTHYYTGTDIGQASTRTIRVLLQDGRSSVSFDGASQVADKQADPQQRYKVKATAAGLKVVDGNGDELGTFGAPLTVKGVTGAIRLLGAAGNGVTDGAYRGTLEIRPSTRGGLTAVNALDLDGYVKGVVPGEVPSNWPAEALKAQAVAARTYALATDAGGTVFDQYADTRSQVYKGLSGEAATASAAVDATSGQVVRYQGQIAVTYFFSTSGGKTEDIANVFYGSPPSPYLVSVGDPFDNVAPRHRWMFVFTRKQMESKLKGLVVGHFKGIKVVKRGVSPRVVSAQVVGTKGVTTTSGVTLRADLGLYDTWFSFAAKKSKAKPSRTHGVNAAGVARAIRAASPAR